MKELSKQFWKETSKLIDAHRKNNDERAAQGVVDSRIVFNRLVKKLTLTDVSQQRELLKVLEYTRQIKNNPKDIQLIVDKLYVENL
jgi:hypothetical protein